MAGNKKAEVRVIPSARALRRATDLEDTFREGHVADYGWIGCEVSKAGRGACDILLSKASGWMAEGCPRWGRFLRLVDLRVSVPGERR